MDYSSLGIKEEIRQAIDKMGFTELTEVQEKAIPHPRALPADHGGAGQPDGLFARHPHRGSLWRSAH